MLSCTNCFLQHVKQIKKLATTHQIGLKLTKLPRPIIKRNIYISPESILSRLPKSSSKNLPDHFKNTISDTYRSALQDLNQARQVFSEGGFKIKTDDITCDHQYLMHLGAPHGEFPKESLPKICEQINSDLITKYRNPAGLDDNFLTLSSQYLSNIFDCPIDKSYINAAYGLKTLSLFAAQQMAIGSVILSSTPTYTATLANLYENASEIHLLSPLLHGVELFEQTLYIKASELLSQNTPVLLSLQPGNPLSYRHSSEFLCKIKDLCIKYPDQLTVIEDLAYLDMRQSAVHSLLNICNGVPLPNIITGVSTSKGALSAGLGLSLIITPKTDLFRQYISNAHSRITLFPQIALTQVFQVTNYTDNGKVALDKTRLLTNEITAAPSTNVTDSAPFSVIDCRTICNDNNITISGLVEYLRINGCPTLPLSNSIGSTLQKIKLSESNANITSALIRITGASLRSNEEAVSAGFMLNQLLLSHQNIQEFRDKYVDQLSEDYNTTFPIHDSMTYQ